MYAVLLEMQQAIILFTDLHNALIGTFYPVLKEGKNSINNSLFRVKYIKKDAVNVIAQYTKPLKIRAEFKQSCHSVFGYFQYS